MINDILENNSNLQLVIGANELKELARIIIDKVRDEFTSEEDRKNDNTYLTNEAACKMLGKSRGTLWRWEKAGYLIPVKVGKTLKYRLSDVLKIKEGKR
ncbi:MAG: helix-turn-helix domain-containing protein [Paramuribaculum sp.]|nr:helix-turn-helix domain-containing protein [Paramuribaculum sp.]